MTILRHRSRERSIHHSYRPLLSACMLHCQRRREHNDILNLRDAAGDSRRSSSGIIQSVIRSINCNSYVQSVLSCSLSLFAHL